MLDLSATTSGAVLTYFLLISAPIILLVISFTAFKAQHIAGGVIALLLIFLLIFYYASVLETLPGISKAAPLVRGLSSYHSWLLDHFPHFDGFSIFGIRVLDIRINAQYVPTWWPIVVLYVGSVIRLVIGWFVRNDRLRLVVREYWLFITSYLMLVLIIDSVTSLSILTVLIVTFIVVLLFLVGIFKIGGDLLLGLINILGHFVKWIRIGLMGLALVATRIARFLRLVLTQARALYERYVISPFRRVHNAVGELEARAEGHLKTKLDQESLEREEQRNRRSSGY